MRRHRSRLARSSHDTSDATHSRLFKRILPALGIVGLGIAAAVYFGSRHLATGPEQIVAQAPSGGGMVINGVHQSAARDGRTEWILDAPFGHLFQEGKIFQLNEPSVEFFAPTVRNSSSPPGGARC